MIEHLEHASELADKAGLAQADAAEIGLDAGWVDAVVELPAELDGDVAIGVGTSVGRRDRRRRGADGSGER